MMQKNIQDKIRKKAANAMLATVRFIIIFGLAFIILKPIVYKILLAFMNPADLLDTSVAIIPKNWSFHYWEIAFKGLNLKETLPNTILLSVTVAIAQVVVCTLIGYALGRIPFKGAKIAFACVILIMMVPNQTIRVAQYLSFVYFEIFGFTVNLTDSFWPVLILAIGGLGIKEGLYIYLFKEQFAAMPKDLEEAAYIDGAGNFSTFLRVMLPNAKTTMVTVFLFSFCWQWTDTDYSSLYFSELRVLANSLSEVRVNIGLSSDQVGTIISKGAASLIIMFPLIFLFVFCQRYFVQSIAYSGLSNG